MYQLIVADPCWQLDDTLKMKKCFSDRKPISTSTLISLKEQIKSLSDPGGCLLMLWSMSSLLVDALTVSYEWGFEVKQSYCWIKTTKTGLPFFGMGRLFRNCHELALVGINTTKLYQQLENHSQRSVVVSPKLGTIKPAASYRSLESMLPKARKLSLFKDIKRQGWEVMVYRESDNTLVKAHEDN